MPGAIDSSQYVSEYTKKTLTQFEWQVGDPIPENLSDILADIHARTPTSKIPGLYIDVALMAAEDIALVKETLGAAKLTVEQQTKKRDVEAKTAGIVMDESTKALYATLVDSTPQIIDDRAEPAPVKSESTDQENTTSDEVPENAPPTDISFTTAPPPAICPRCAWDTRMEFNTVVTDEDKEAFIAITLGGERFKKTFSVMGGKYEVKFRSLLAEENTKIHHQLLLDQKADETQFLSDTEWFLRMFEYRLACSVEFTLPNNKPAALVPELDEVTQTFNLPNKSDDVTKPPLVRLREYVIGHLLKHEITRRMVSNEFRRFQRLCETLEAMALEPNFW